MNSKSRTLITLLAVALSSATLATSANAATGNAREALTHIDAAGLVAPHDLAYRYGLWSASVTTLDGKQVWALLDPATDAVNAINKAEVGISLPSVLQVRQTVGSMGYWDIDDIELDDGLWEVEARNSFGKVKLIVHPITLALLSEQGVTHENSPTGILSAAQVIQALQAAGYRNIHDLEYDDGVWEADAINSRGWKVELKIDPVTGSVIREKRD